MPAGQHDIHFSQIWPISSHSVGNAVIVDNRWVVHQHYVPYQDNLLVLDVIDIETGEETQHAIGNNYGYRSIVALNNGKVAILSTDYCHNSKFSKQSYLASPDEQKKIMQEFCNVGAVDIFDIQQMKKANKLAIGDNIELVYSLPTNHLVSVHDIDTLEETNFAQAVKLWDLSDLHSPRCLHTLKVNFHLLAENTHFKWQNNKLYISNTKHIAVFDPQKSINQAETVLHAKDDEEFTDYIILQNGQMIVSLRKGMIKSYESALQSIIEFYNDAFEKTHSIINPNALGQNVLKLQVIADEKYFLCWDSSPIDFNHNSSQGNVYVWDIKKAQVIEVSRLISSNYSQAITIPSSPMPLSHMTIMGNNKAFIHSPSTHWKWGTPSIGIIDFSTLRTLQLQTTNAVSLRSQGVFGNSRQNNDTDESHSLSFYNPEAQNRRHRFV